MPPLPSLRRTVLLGLAAGLTACLDAPTAADTDRAPSTLAISDGAHGGNAHFFFLPPLTAAPSYQGVFDATLAPAVEICELAAGSCAATVARFDMTSGTGSEVVRIVPADEHYIVNWHTDGSGLDPAKTYRIRVSVDGFELGHADVDVVGSGRELRSVDTGEFIALVEGRTLPIKFRVEEGAIPTVAAVITPAGGALTLDGFGSVTIPAGALAGERLVRLSATATPETARDFAETVPLAVTVRAGSELRLEVGQSLPLQPVDVVVEIPVGFPATLPAGHVPALWMQVYQDVGQSLLDGFVRIPAVADGATLRATLPDYAFASARRSDGVFEAIVVLGAAPAPAPPPSLGLGRTGPAIALQVQEPVCEGSRLESPLGGTLRVNSPFGGRHQGVDYAAANGDPVYAAGSGTIERIGWDVRQLTAPDPRSGLMVKGWGRYVRIRLDDGNAVLVAHLIENSTNHLVVDERVNAGDQIGEADNTGGSTGPHLHMEHVLADGTRVDPDRCVSRGPKNFAGNWSGTYSGASVNGSWIWTLTQNDAAVSGTTSLSGTLTGTVRDDVLTLTITYPTGATNTGSVTISGETLTGPLVLNFPGGGTANFSTTMTRGGGSGGAAQLSIAAASPGMVSYTADGQRR